MPEPLTTRRTIRVRWLVALFLLLVAGWFLYQLFGSDPRIIVSKETTFITEPLGPDGLPNYCEYLLDQSSEGVTSDNNAAVLIWRALWPGELSLEHQLPMCQVLGLQKVPSEEDSLVGP